MREPRFTVVTPTLNCGAVLARNLASVAGQDFAPDELEHWVIDGGSRDGTLDLLRFQPFAKFISEPDRGLSDAVNKGILRAAGEWILWVNADDELAPGALAAIRRGIADHPDARMFCGAEEIYSYDGRLEQLLPPCRYEFEALLRREFSINQAATVVHREVYHAAGLLNATYRHAMDYEWTVRAASRFNTILLDHVLARYHRRPGSIMDAGMAQQYRAILRVRRQWCRPYFEPAELALRTYILLDPLRQVRWLRRMVRRAKELAGHAPLHPLPQQP